MNNVTISIITSTSPEYTEVFHLRDKILRWPLGMSLKNDDLSRDHIDTIFIAKEGGKIIGCVLLHDLKDGQAQLRAMAVDTDWQGRGIGRLLVNALEDFSIQKGYNSIILHARKVALGFYSGLGYTTTGDEFTEVNIPHYLMHKSLSDK